MLMTEISLVMWGLDKGLYDKSSSLKTLNLMKIINNSQYFSNFKSQD